MPSDFNEDRPRWGLMKISVLEIAGVSMERSKMAARRVELSFPAIFSSI